MGKKRIITQEEEKTKPAEKNGGSPAPAVGAVVGKTSSKRVSSAILYIQSTYNNTLMNLTDEKGNSLMWSTSGSMGFSGARKGTPFAASKVAEVLVEKAKNIGVKEIEVVINGVGAGRESALRTFAAKGIEIKAIRDMTPVPHNGPKGKKSRRV